MTGYGYGPAGEPEPAAFGSTPPHVDARTLWAGGGATALVAALVAATGVLVSQGLFDTPVIGLRSGTSVTLLGFAVGAAIAGLAATGLAHLLLRSTPRPLVFFTWIATLTTVIASLWPFIAEATLSTRLASALVTLAVGLCITSLVGRVAVAAVRPARGPAEGRPHGGMAS